MSISWVLSHKELPTFDSLTYKDSNFMWLTKSTLFHLLPITKRQESSCRHLAFWLLLEIGIIVDNGLLLVQGNI